MFPKPAKRLKDARRALRATRPKRLKLCVDWQATHAARFADQKSYVALDGRWVCYGKDMTARRAECYRRAKGICAKCGAHVAWEHGEADHILSKGQNLRNDHPSNLQWLCGNWSFNRCHAKEHNREVRWSRV